MQRSSQATVVYLVVFAAVSLAAVAAAASDPTDTTGTEEMPELSDASGDVAYEDHYTGPQDHDYLDILAAWIEYDNQTDQVAFHLKVSDASLLQDPPDGWSISCAVEGTMTNADGPTGTITYGWAHRTNGTSYTVLRFEPPDSAPAVNLRPQDISHIYEKELDEPGYFRFWAQREAVIQFGNAFNNPHATCQETYPLSDASQLSKLYWNRDDGESTASYAFAALEPAAAADEQDPFASASPTSPTSTSTNASPGLPLVVALLVAWVLVWRTSRST